MNDDYEGIVCERIWMFSDSCINPFYTAVARGLRVTYSIKLKMPNNRKPNPKRQCVARKVQRPLRPAARSPSWFQQAEASPARAAVVRVPGAWRPI